jgi:N-glycosylase/DNA lyase
MKKKLNEMIWNCVQVKDNRLTLSVGKEYFKKNEIPEIYYNFTLESLKETNDGLDKWEKEGMKVDVDKLFEDAKKELLKIKGVGEKVAQCALLYGFGRLEAFPQDVWVKRIVSELYPDGLPECIKGTEGIAQQYLFHWRRNLDNSK